MERRNLTCINCPMGCELEVSVENGAVVSVSGNSCPRGVRYAEKEVSAPSRVVTGTVLVSHGDADVVSAKTEQDVSKEKVLEVARAMSALSVDAPIELGDVLAKDIAGTGVNLISTRSVRRA